MCFPENLIIAIFGSSCTGKTTVAQLLANELNADLRICGEIVRNESKRLNISYDKLGLDWKGNVAFTFPIKKVDDKIFVLLPKKI